jgi:hypothetical protein
MEELSRLVLLLIAVALVINLIKHGPAGAKAWLGAKFLGHPAPPAFLGKNAQTPKRRASTVKAAG